MKINPKRKKDTNNRHTAKKLYVLIAVGFMLLLISLIMMLVEPLLIIMKYMTRIEIGSEYYNILQNEIPGACLQVYVFNITNAEAFLSGDDHKLKVEEVGPFTYREYRMNKDFELDEQAGVMRYTPQYRTEFLPKESIGDPRNINITVPNTTLLTLASMFSGYSNWRKVAFNILVNRMKSAPVVNLDVQSQLWEYNDSLMSFSNAILPNWINSNKVAILDLLYNQTLVPRFEVGATSADKFQIKTLNGSPGLKMWDYDNPSKRTLCNIFKDTYEGIGYPPGFTAKTTIKMYRNMFCRMLDLKLSGTRTLDYGTIALVYKMSKHNFKVGPSTECLCGKRGCKNGVTDLSPCLNDLHLALSQAHFLHADPRLYDRIDGIQPDEEKHGSEILIDPKFGAVLKSHFSIQINIDLQDVSFNKAAKPFSNMVVPLAYIKMIQPDIQENEKEKYKIMYFTVSHIIYGLELFVLILGLIILAYVVQIICCNFLYSKIDIDNRISNNEKEHKKLQIEEPLIQDKYFDQIKVLDSE